MQNGWVVARIKSNQGARAADNVVRQGAEFYSPRAMLRSPRTRLLRPQPLFPGYAFVCHPEGQWVFLRGTYGVLDVIMSTDEKPAYLSADEIVGLRAKEGPDGLVQLDAPEFMVGEHVHVNRGKLSLDAIFDSMAGQDRVYVLLGVLGGARTLVPAKDVTRE